MLACAVLSGCASVGEQVIPAAEGSKMTGIQYGELFWSGTITSAEGRVWNVIYLPGASNINSFFGKGGSFASSLLSDTDSNNVLASWQDAGKMLRLLAKSDFWNDRKQDFTDSTQIAGMLAAGALDLATLSVDSGKGNAKAAFRSGNEHAQAIASKSWETSKQLPAAGCSLAKSLFSQSLEHSGKATQGGWTFAEKTVREFWLDGIAADKQKVQEESAAIPRQFGRGFSVLLDWTKFGFQAVARTLAMPVGVVGGLAFGATAPVVVFVGEGLVAPVTVCAVGGLVAPLVMIPVGGAALPALVWTGESVIGATTVLLVQDVVAPTTVTVVGAGAAATTVVAYGVVWPAVVTVGTGAVSLAQGAYYGMAKPAALAMVSAGTVLGSGAAAGVMYGWQAGAWGVASAWSKVEGSDVVPQKETRFIVLKYKPKPISAPREETTLTIDSDGLNVLIQSSIARQLTQQDQDVLLQQQKPIAQQIADKQAELNALLQKQRILDQDYRQNADVVAMNRLVRTAQHADKVTLDPAARLVLMDDSQLKGLVVQYLKTLDRKPSPELVERITRQVLHNLEQMNVIMQAQADRAHQAGTSPAQQEALPAPPAPSDGQGSKQGKK